MKVKDIKNFERQHNIELSHDDISENGIIGTVLAHPSYIYKSEYLKPNMFYNRELACIYYIISDLLNKGIIEIDNFLIINEIEGNKGFKATIEEFDDISNDIVGWLDGLKEVARSSTEEYELIVKKVVSHAFKRESYIKLCELSNYVLNSNDDINKLNYKLQTDVTKFADTYIVNTDVQLMGDKVEDLWNLITSRRNNGFSGIPSKYKDLNKYFTYENGELVVIGGRAKSGKSMFFLNEAIHKVENGVPTAIFDTEMSDERWLVRYLALKTGIDIQRVKSGEYSKEEEIEINNAIKWLKDKPLIHIYDPDWTKDKIYMVAKQLKSTIGLGFLIYDYIKVNDTSAETKEHNVLGDMTNFLKNKVGGALDIPVLAGGQMSPKEERLADSDKINRYASTIAYWIHKTKEEQLNDGKDAGNCKFRIDYN
ncbi:MAG: DnaB-like helicase C-terminal domain-containing protein, partial [Clostridium sp.]|uniref:DnaB-like helicase C-terminal domain-containing protein n=1 Tax=Clostridium sp. TaxID=1506 RepID=UPI003EE6A8C4